MAKEKFKRSNVKSSILKKVIIRIDFMGLTDIVGCVDSLKKVMHGKFNIFKPISNKNYNVELPGVNNKKGVNVNLEERTFYQFSDSQIGTSKANFVLGTDFAIIDVSCDSHYEGCDEYIKLMAESIDCILKFDTFISIQRIGLRKFDVAEFESEEEMEKAIECSIWNNYKRDSAYVPLKKTYLDLLYQKDVSTVFRIQRIIQMIVNDDQKKYQYSFDIDSYKNESLINKDDFASEKSIKNMISKQMNEPVFNYFIDTFTEQYIDNFYNE